MGRQVGQAGDQKTSSSQNCSRGSNVNRMVSPPIHRISNVNRMVTPPIQWRVCPILQPTEQHFLGELPAPAPCRVWWHSKRPHTLCSDGQRALRGMCKGNLKDGRNPSSPVSLFSCFRFLFLRKCAVLPHIIRPAFTTITSHHDPIKACTYDVY